MYKYYLYGLNVESDFAIDEAYEMKFLEDSRNVRICLNAKSDVSYDKEYTSLVSKDSFHLNIKEVAKYDVDKSDEIKVVPYMSVEEQPVKTFLLGSSFGYWFILHNRVAIHGGAVSNGEKGVIITGESGAGKSTVNTNLFSKGYSFIADDVCALSVDDNRVRINMAYPQLKLCRDAALNMGYDLSELKYINEDRDKFALRLKDGYRKDGAEFKYLFEIKLHDGDELKIEEVTGLEKMQTIIANVYRGENAFETWGVAPEYMKQCLFIASKIQIYRIWRPKDKNTLDEILDFVEGKLK